MKDNQDPDAALIALLRTLPAEEPPPASLLARLLGRLRAERLIAPPAARAHDVRAGMFKLAAALTLFAGGYVARAVTGVGGDSPTHMLLLYGAPTGSASEHTARAREYAAWAGTKRSDERIVGGEALGPAVAPKGGATSARDSVVARSTDLVGYFLIVAGNGERAAALARTCPHLRYGGSVVVREIVKS